MVVVTVPLSKVASSETHGENSPYFAGWRAYEEDPYHELDNPNGVIQMGLAENQVPCYYYILKSITLKYVMKKQSLFSRFFRFSFHL